MKDGECVWNTSEHYRNKQLVKMHYKNSVQVPEVPKLSVKNLKFKIKTIRAGLPKVTKQHKHLSPIRHLHAEIVLVQTLTHPSCVALAFFNNFSAFN
jgi:hypothetical protein